MMSDPKIKGPDKPLRETNLEWTIVAATPHPAVPKLSSLLALVFSC